MANPMLANVQQGAGPSGLMNVQNMPMMRPNTGMGPAGGPAAGVPQQQQQPQPALEPVSCRHHQLGQPGVQRIDQQQSHERCHPDAQRIAQKRVTEQRGGGHPRFARGGDGQRQAETAGDCPRLGLASPAQQKGGGFGQRRGHQGDQDQPRHSADHEQRPPPPDGVLPGTQHRQQHRDREGDARLRPGRHRQDQPAHQTPSARRRPLHRQRDRGRVLPGHEDAAQEAQQQHQRDGPAAQQIVGGHRRDRQRAGGRATDREPGGAGAAQPVRDPPEHDTADGPPEQHRDDDQCGRGRRRARPGGWPGPGMSAADETGAFGAGAFGAGAFGAGRDATGAARMATRTGEAEGPRSPGTRACRETPTVER